MIRGFAPIYDARARVLILGTMPSVASLGAQEYYAHARNAFWPIMASLCGADAHACYADRCAMLQKRALRFGTCLQAAGGRGALIRPSAMRSRTTLHGFGRGRILRPSFATARRRSGFLRAM